MQCAARFLRVAAAAPGVTRGAAGAVARSPLPRLPLLVACMHMSASRISP